MALSFRSAADYAKGFGGRYGVQKDRVDKVSDAHSLLAMRAEAARGAGRQSLQPGPLQMFVDYNAHWVGWLGLIGSVVHEHLERTTGLRPRSEEHERLDRAPPR